MPKRRRVRVQPVTRAEFAALRRDLQQIRAVVKAAADGLDALRKDGEMNLRRCGELQAEIDSLRKLLETA